MNREELISLLDEVREEIRIFERPSVDNSKKMLELLTEVVVAHPLPPAEGAEEILRKNCNTCYSRSTGEEEVWSSVSSVLIAMQEFAAQPQPTAEGAEEMDARTYLDEWMRQHNYRSNKLIGWSEAVDFADDFAILHAQRIADKMVEERLRITANDLKRIKNRKI